MTREDKDLDRFQRLTEKRYKDKKYREARSKLHQTSLL